ncbi:8126_t:CDS:2 [Cetraspora pellucida]|uniref:8126_t:CDS:1 n=1 Tax=Cetraspora pellucida TaxID=1433469 RepID=A0A9N9PF05_9GLOM|nr:8126_t:CDS:2 [Cetraspora pellucida]
MTGRGTKRVLVQTSDSEDENNLLITESSGAQQSRQHSDDNDKRSICWRYFNPFKVPKRGEITKCTIDGCNKKYTWSGSTSNLVKHLKTKHGIPPTTVQPSLTNNSFRNFEVNLPVIKFIVSSILPFDIVDNLNSSGLVNSQITPSIIANQIPQSKVQQAKSAMLSISVNITDKDDDYIIVACNWLTKDFEFHKIFMYMYKFIFIDIAPIDYNIEDLIKWGLTNLKFISYIPGDLAYFKSFYFYDNLNFDEVLDELKGDSENMITCVSGGSGDGLIRHSLKRWAEKNTNVQEMSDIINAILNATQHLCSVIEFLKDEKNSKNNE